MAKKDKNKLRCLKKIALLLTKEIFLTKNQKIVIKDIVLTE